MFDAVLKPRWIPRGRIANGAAFAVAVHAWLLVPLLARPSPSNAKEKGPPPTIDLVLASSPTPPPLGTGGPPPKSTAPARRRAPQTPVLRPPTDARPAAAPAPADSAPPSTPSDTPGDSQGDGDANGDPNGVVGGTGTGTPVTPPPSTLLMHLGDPALDQSTCQLSGQPPYPKEALTQKVEATIVTRCTVGPTGALTGCALLKSHPFFDGPVTSFLSSAHARPFTASGKPVSVQCVFKFTYKME